MAITNLGAVGISAGGAYNPGTVYKKYKVVSANGGSYMYINPTPAAGVPVTDTSHWQQIASVGGQDLVDAAVAAKNTAVSAKDTAVAAAAQLAAGTASPAGTYANLAALNSGTPATPNVAKIYITLDDGKWCYHNGFAFVAGGVYQSASDSAELVDIRVGADGKTYESAGSAVRGQISDLKSDLSQMSDSHENLASGMPNLPRAMQFDSVSNQATLYNSYTQAGNFYVALKSGKVYLSIIKFDIGLDDTSTQGTVRLTLTKKDTASTEPLTVSSRKDVYLSLAAKGSSQCAYNIGTVSEDTSVYYKLVSYSSGTSSRHYNISIKEIITFEFNTVSEANDFVDKHINETTQDGWATAIDLIARKNTNLLAQIPYNGKTCCVIGDSLSASYYDMWCTYFAQKTGISLTNSSAGGTSVAVRDGYTSSFVERISAISDEYDVWIIFGGMNDKDGVPIGDMTSTSTSTFYGAYKAILSDLQTRSNHPQVIMIAPYYNVDAILPYIDAIRDIAEHYGVPLVDLSKISGVNPTTRSIYTRDWTHPNQLLCDRIRPQITRELCEKIVFPETTDPMPN